MSAIPSDKNEAIVSWAGITQGMNTVNLHAVLYSTAEKNMVHFVERVLLFRS